MRYVGVDLAWGSRSLSGLAVLDDAGTLLSVGSRRSDDEILEWLGPWVSDSCLVAFDAPLVVTNASGHRACDRLIARYFGRYQAYCHVVSLERPAFASGPRALRLASALGLSLLPGPRRAVEVYPHPAIVVLFGLSRILRYKARSGRSLSFRRGELLRLIGLLEGLSVSDVPLYAGQHEDWNRIVGMVRTAGSQADLGRVEDSIDAVVCAYVALYATVRPSAVRFLGDVSSGSVLVPVTPEIASAVDSLSVPSRP